MVNSILHGTVVIHASGIHYLDKNKDEGTDIFQLYDNNARNQLIKLNQYQNNGDLVLFSTYDPIKQETPAFEELVGHHGGLGGKQTEPFVMYPAFLNLDQPVKDSTEMHSVLCNWQKEIHKKIDS